MPPPTGPRYYGANAEHRAQIRAGFRAAARLVQAMNSRGTELERTMERLRDRSTLPTPEQVRGQIAGKWQAHWNALKAAEGGIKDLFDLFY